MSDISQRDSHSKLHRLELIYWMESHCSCMQCCDSSDEQLAGLYTMCMIKRVRARARTGTVDMIACAHESHARRHASTLDIDVVDSVSHRSIEHRYAITHRLQKQLHMIWYLNRFSAVAACLSPFSVPGSFRQHWFRTFFANSVVGCLVLKVLVFALLRMEN